MAQHGPRVPLAASLARIFVVMTMASATASLLFNFTTNGNGQLLRERFAGIVEDPATLGVLLALVYVVASFAQVAMGLLIDRFRSSTSIAGSSRSRRRCSRSPRTRRAGRCSRCMIAFMIVVFGAIPFTDAMIVRFVDDRMRSRVSGMRLFVSFGVSSLAVWLLGPVVKAAGFGTLLWSMAAIAVVTFLAVLWLPRRDPRAISVARRRTRHRDRLAQRIEDARAPRRSPRSCAGTRRRRRNRRRGRPPR